MGRYLTIFCLLLTCSSPALVHADEAGLVKDLMFFPGKSRQFNIDGISYESRDAGYYAFKNGRALFLFPYQGMVVGLSGEEDRSEGSSRYVLVLDRITFGDRDGSTTRIAARGKCLIDFREGGDSFSWLRCLATSTDHVVTIDLQGDEKPITLVMHNGELVEQSENPGFQPL